MVVDGCKRRTPDNDPEHHALNKRPHTHFPQCALRKARSNQKQGRRQPELAEMIHVSIERLEMSQVGASDGCQDKQKDKPRDLHLCFTLWAISARNAAP